MPERRIKDEAYGTYSVYTALKTGSGLCVTCPHCGRMGVVTASKRQSQFRCTCCGHSEAKERMEYRYRVQNLCESCGRYYNVPILDRRRQTFPVLRVPCPYCGFVMPGRVEKTRQPYGYSYGVGIEKGRDPLFGFELWFLTEFDGKPVWALNREHLAYLIGYLSAGLREKPLNWSGGRTQANTLPTFMKTAKNRERLVKQLQKLQQKGTY